MAARSTATQSNPVQENWAVAGVRIAVWGVRWGPPWSQSVDMGPLVRDGVGGEKKMAGLRILG